MKWWTKKHQNWFPIIVIIIIIATRKKKKNLILKQININWITHLNSDGGSKYIDYVSEWSGAIVNVKS